MRRLVLLLAAAGTLIEAVAFGGGLYLLGTVIESYQMSMGGRPASEGRVVVWVLGAVLAIALVVLSAMLSAAVVRDRPLGRPTRVMIISALVLHGILGIIVTLSGSVAGLIGVLAVFCCLLLGLVLPPGPIRMPARHDATL
jgi:hypothetical protein